MNDTPARKPMTADDIAERWHCEPETVLRSRNKWGLKGFRFGRKMLFTPESVAEAERLRLRQIAPSKAQK